MIVALGAVRIIIGLLLFLGYIIFAALVGYDLARHKFINAWACVLACAIFLLLILLVVIL